MSELVVTLIRLGYLVLLWLLVLAAIGVLRRDISGTRVLARGSLMGRSSAKAAPDGGAAPGRGARAKRGAPTRLVVTAGPLNGTTLRLGENSILLGRAPSSTLVLDDDYSSTRHARIFPADGGWYVEDLGSTNGTWLGSSQVEGPTPVPAGTPIRVGQTVIELRR
ncbi:FHA domain-containing protein FhaB/FipA [Pseudactinotalea suaedae]|uniref:FHA domain-containing protein FhaB/FipA n=1 Tax=Pseudactinotalea suaedae TaxID=1524924 RepID=UPI0012E3271D|nr:FHA domain-containing protein [Pseudactinotalea suaedae]